jgi:hypothetical protein
MEMAVFWDIVLCSLVGIDTYIMVLHPRRQPSLDNKAFVAVHKLHIILKIN